MTFAKFQENRFKIDMEIPENHAILVNLTASIGSGREITAKPVLLANVQISENYFVLL